MELEAGDVMEGRSSRAADEVSALTEQGSKAARASAAAVLLSRERALAFFFFFSCRKKQVFVTWAPPSDAEDS